MADAQLIADARLLGTKIDELKAALARQGRPDLIREIDEPFLVGSTSLEIHYMLRAALFQIRPKVAADPDAVRLLDDVISLIARIVSNNS